MARLYKTNGEFGPVGLSYPTKPIAEMSVGERTHIYTTRLAHLGGIKWPNERKVKIGSPRWDVPLQWDNSPNMNRPLETNKIFQHVINLKKYLSKLLVMKIIS